MDLIDAGGVLTSATAGHFDSFDQMTAATINALADSIHDENLKAGWWEIPADHPWAKYEVGTKVALVHSEVSESLEGYRRDMMDDKLPHRPALEVEIADSIIRLLDIARREGLDVGGAIVEKRGYNGTRDDHKPEVRAAKGGKKF